jgi:RNA polymerase sigma factor (sigma-70 family)
MDQEKELIERCLAKDPKAQEILYKLYSAKMYGVCLRYAQNSMEAEDILQEGYIKVFTYLKDYRFEGSLEGWVRRTIVNTAINYYKHRIREAQEISLERVDLLNQGTESILDAMSANDLLLLIQKLPEGYRMVFNLCVIEGYTHKEIGEMLNISENTSKSQLSRARNALQNMILQRKTNK